MANPTLVEVTRGPLVESTHTGAIVVSRGDGDVVAMIGDGNRVTFPRSSIKALQCIPVLETGTADHFGFKAEHLALACGSHVGTSQHAHMAGAMLDQIGLGEEALGCGAHTPLGAGAAKELWAAGGKPTQLHNNCSGKHVAMLATALHLGDPVADYWEPDHPVQMRVHEVLREWTGLELGRDVMGIDGCSVPNWAIPLTSLADAFAKLVRTSDDNDARGRAVQRILNACWTRPDLVAGKGRADTVVMSELPGKVFMKTGAEGVYAGAFKDLGIGFALKIDDGTTRASAGTAMALIETVVPAARGLIRRRIIQTWRGMNAGEIRAAPALQDFLADLKGALA